MNLILLAIAIVCEVVATSALKQTAGFTRLVPSAVALTGYALAIYFLALTVRTLPVGIVYAVWSGTGVVLIAAIGYFFLGERPDFPAVVGLTMIVAGVLIVNLFSKTMGH